MTIDELERTSSAPQVEVNRGGVAGAGEAGFDPDAIGERFRWVLYSQYR